MLDYKKFKIKINALTPIHIGNGDVYSQLDYVFDKTNKKVFVIDFNRIIANSSPSAINDLTSEIKKNFGNNRWRGDVAEFFRRYKLDWEDFVIKEIPCENVGNNEIHQFVNSTGRCYIPGSSIKGAIRTALIYNLLSKESISKNIQEIIHDDRIKAKYASDSFSKEVFGNNPYYDVLRTLIFSDSSFGNIDDILVKETVLLNLSKTKQKRFIPLFLEIIKSNICYEQTLKLDSQLYKIPILKFNKEISKIDNIIGYSNNFSRSLINKESEEIKSYEILHKSYTKLLNNLRNLNENECIIRIGKGGGFFSKTFSSLLEADKLLKIRKRFNIFSEIICNKHNSKIMRNHYCPDCRRKLKNNKDNDEYHYEYDEVFFPRTRLVTFDNGKPSEPLGWVKLTFEENA